jgi:uncharacterized protein YjbI with pentapeptide repeats
MSGDDFITVCRKVLGIVLVMAGLAAQAQAQDFSAYKVGGEPLRQPEELVLRKLARGEPANLLKELVEPLIQGKEKITGLTDLGKESLDALLREHGGKLRLRAEFLEKVLTDEFTGFRVHRRGFDLRNAVIEGKLDLASAKVAPKVIFKYCIFQGDVNLQDSHFKESLQILDSQFNRELYAIRMMVDRFAYFNNTRFQDLVNFSHANLGKEFSLLGVKAENERPDKIFAGVQVGETLHADSNTRFGGKVNFRGLKVGQNAYFTGTQFLSKTKFVIFAECKVGNSLFFNKAVFHGPVDFQDLEVGKDLEAYASTFHFKDAKQEEKGAAHLEAPEIKVGGQANFDGAVFEGTVKFANASVRKKFSAEGARFNGEQVIFAGATLGKADFDRAVFRGEVDFVKSHITDLFLGSKTIRGLEPSPISTLNLENATVDDDLTIANARLNELKAANLAAKGRLKISGVTIERQADLRDSNIQSLALEQVQWPKARIFLDDLAFRNLSPDSFTDYLRFINSSKINSKIYRQTEEYFKRIGREDLADEVYIQMHRHELEQYSWYDPRPWIYWIFWDIPTGYGRKKLRLLWLALAFITMGAAAFDPKYLDLESEQSLKKIKNPYILRLLLSIDIFLPKLPQKVAAFIRYPGLDLGVAKAWRPPEPMPHRLWLYWQIHRIFGTIIVVAAFPAIIKLIQSLIEG